MSKYYPKDKDKPKRYKKYLKDLLATKRKTNHRNPKRKVRNIQKSKKTKRVKNSILSINHQRDKLVFKNSFQIRSAKVSNKVHCL